MDRASDLMMAIQSYTLSWYEPELFRLLLGLEDDYYLLHMLSSAVHHRDLQVSQHVVSVVFSSYFINIVL